MERYYKLVLNLYKEAHSDPFHQVNSDHRLEAMKTISGAIVTARIYDQPTDTLEALLSDVKQIRTA